MTLRVRASSAARYPAAIFSVEVREKNRLAFVIVDRNAGPTALSKNLLTLCFFTGYLLRRHADEAANFSAGETVSRRARPEDVHPTRGDRCARVAANTFLLVARLGNVLALREVKQRDPRDKA
jgi:hypothetical protein